MLVWRWLFLSFDLRRCFCWIVSRLYVERLAWFLQTLKSLSLALPAGRSRTVTSWFSKVITEADTPQSAWVPVVTVFWWDGRHGHTFHHRHPVRLTRAVVVDDVSDASLQSVVQTDWRQRVREQVYCTVLRQATDVNVAVGSASEFEVVSSKGGSGRHVINREDGNIVLPPVEDKQNKLP